ncbi:MAG: hypothetical protein DYG98_27670 [Haliscomenobacteraceae bacterium CHB4]|nr:hypothetical protein [Saprospiraceae bacterium]MCE7926834.1 hypothetical protein [Haliscomenobacteraceae bacterium CHB4]
MSEQRKLSNLQLELLKVFSYNLTEEQLLEIKNLLSNYFLEKARDEMDRLWDEHNWTEETMHEWAHGHTRRSSNSPTLAS